MLRLSLLAALAALALAGCDGQLEGDFTPRLVVSANLGAGLGLPPVALSETSPLLEPYDPAAVAVADAQVTVTLLAADGSDEAVYPYRFGALRYEPVLDERTPGAPTTVLPGRTYRLDVRARETLTAVTTVPPMLELVEGPADRVVYGNGQGPEIRIRQTSTPGRQAAFVASTLALEPAAFRREESEGETFYRSIANSGFLPVPVYQRFLGCEAAEDGQIRCDSNPDDARTGSSPVINEESYIDLGDGTALVQVPFLAFGYFGPYEITLTSVDAALQAFVQTQAVQGGGTTLSPGEIPNITSNIEGGVGVFGSYAQVSAVTTLDER